MYSSADILSKIGAYNVVFIVLDSCRYDTASKAKTLFFDSISPLRMAETPATYTLPAHISFFSGILPILIDGNPQYLPGIRQIWRSVNAREGADSVGTTFHEKNIIDYYYGNGYNVVGFGGVSFFSSARNNILPGLFPKFIHFEKPANLFGAVNVPRGINQFPLANVGRIIENLKGDSPFFLFVNCPETHIPFDCPGTHISKEYKGAVEKMYAIDGIKHRQVAKNERLSENERKILLTAQRYSLEWIDRKIEELFSNVQNDRPILVLVMGDHGEEFGEGGRYGHAHYHPLVMRVPFWGGILNG